MVKKILFISALVVALSAYALWNTLSSRTNSVMAVVSTPITPAPQPASYLPPPSTPPPPTQGRYKNGVYTGVVADAFYGPLQVQAVIKNGTLNNVVFLQYPSDNPHSSEVSSFALPQLKQEAIAIQSAQVNVVSGATQTSGAFTQTLSSALTQAR